MSKTRMDFFILHKGFYYKNFHLVNLKLKRLESKLLSRQALSDTKPNSVFGVKYFLQERKLDLKQELAFYDKSVHAKKNKYIIDLQWFAAEDEGRTEDPSEYKLRKAREEGRVAKSAELPVAIALISVALTLLLFGKNIFSKSLELMTFFFTRCTTETLSVEIFNVFLKFFTSLVLPISLVACLVIIISYVIQFRGFIFSTKLIAPNFQKISPNIFRYFKRTLFSGEGLFNLFKSIFKVACVILIVFLVIRNNTGRLLILLRSDVTSAVFFVAELAIYILFFVALLFLFFSIADYFFQRKQFMDSLKMSKQEVKEEYKELEGDPKIKGQIRKRMQDLLARTAIQNVPEADVVITNPTHLAIAMKYEQEKMEAPLVLAKGADLMAEKIKEIAREHEIPIIENKPLTRAIYANVELGDIIPAEYYRAMSLIFAQVYAMNEKKRQN